MTTLFDALVYSSFASDGTPHPIIRIVATHFGYLTILVNVLRRVSVKNKSRMYKLHVSSSVTVV